MCFEDFGNGDWVTVEFPNAYFDGNGYAIGGVPLDVDPVFGALGCSITPYLGPTGVTNFYPQVSGALLAAYEIDLDGFPVPVGPDNPIRVTIGYHGFSLEQNKEQQLLLYHAPDGLNAVDVTDEYRSNRKGNLDGGYLMSTLRESASPFILAFAGGDFDCASIVVDGFEAPMGATRQLGSKLPLKARLVVDGAPQASADALAALGFDAALVRVYDVTDATHPAVVAERALRDTGAKWSHELDLAAPTFARGRTYEARVLLGSCEIQPTSSRFQIR